MNLERCKIYFVSYAAYGHNRQYCTLIESFVIAIDVIDVVKQIEKDCLGVEINCTINGESFHDVTEEIIINNCSLVGEKLHGISDKAWELINKSDDDDQLDEDQS